jgi:hypothetical protein
MGSSFFHSRSLSRYNSASNIECARNDTYCKLNKYGFSTVYFGGSIGSSNHSHQIHPSTATVQPKQALFSSSVTACEYFIAVPIAYKLFSHTKRNFLKVLQNSGFVKGTLSRSSPKSNT